MTRDEFIKTACKMGYCSKKIAGEYSEGKDTLTEDDFIEVHRMEENRRYKYKGHPLGDGAYARRSIFPDGEEEGNR